VRRAAGPDWLVLTPAGVLVALGALFVAAPRWGAVVFGVAPPEGPALAYLRAIGLRDLAFGAYLVVLARTADRRALGLVLAATTIIPAGDLIIVALTAGAVWQLGLHALSGIYLAGAAAWMLTRNGRKEGTA